MADPHTPDLPLLMKLGSALIHADEALSMNGTPVDIDAFNSIIVDPDVQQWIKDMGPLLPVKR